MKDWSRALNHIVMIGQLGFSLVVPVLMCLGLCWLLTDRFGLGSWIYIPGFILGIGASFMTAYKVYLAEVKRSSREEEKPHKAFNRHY